MDIEVLTIGSLKPYARNPRTHSDKQINQIARSIRQFGFTNPILIDPELGVIAGHGRIEAAKLLGISEVPTIRLDHMTEAQKRAYVIADNRLAENAGWDRELLALELQYLSDLELDFDATITGFDTPEIDVLIQGLNLDGTSDQTEEIPEVDRSVTPVSRLGDLWELGDHRVLCADATEAASFDYLLEAQRAQMVFVDPPYNVPIDGHVCGLGAIKHREFQMAAGEMSEPQFIEFLKTTLGHLATFSIDGSIHFVCMDWRHCFELTSAGRDVYDELKNLCVWNKDNGGMGSLYRSKHELVFVFKRGSAAHINNIELGRHGRYRTNVWDYAGINTMRAGRMDDLAMHPTVKPTALVADAILDCSTRRGIVLDCFGGSGTTLLAAEKTGRRAYLMELDPAYVDVTIQRYQKLTGKVANHAATGATFADTRAERAEKSL
ncbi:MAG: DNA methyltransferase [Candidatus Binatus sp.]|uniref:site-specific DNA-methyltransferase n=1 Tax=Candidatus Binatus sp. TaxID=2811406 RepID=UPI002721EE21|nr:DNA methyltransferase [Candidatus Binatus sp.]MDO8432184.1 DNA methyltransferase [Candidatus Binatus sp.]